MNFKEINPGRTEIVRLMSNAVRDGKSITISVNGDNGVAAVKINRDFVAKFRDVYDMLSIMMPELTEEFA